MAKAKKRTKKKAKKRVKKGSRKKVTTRTVTTRTTTTVSNPAQGYYLTIFGSGSDDEIWNRALIVRARNESDVESALDDAATGEDEVLWGRGVLEDERFVGSSVERSGDGFYYIAGWDGEYPDETPLGVLRFGSLRRYPTMEAAKKAAVKLGYNTHFLARVDAPRGALAHIKVGSKVGNPRKTSTTKKPKLSVRQLVNRALK